MATDNRVKIKLVLKPVKSPWVRVMVANHQQQKQIDTVTEFEFDFLTTESTVPIVVEHFDKQNFDTETAVEIIEISLFGISDPKLYWAGTYYPDYPEPWYSQQTQKPLQALSSQTYLGWNGAYKLEISVPVFEWMHKTLNLGWIYR